MPAKNMLQGVFIFFLFLSVIVLLGIGTAEASGRNDRDQQSRLHTDNQKRVCERLETLFARLSIPARLPKFCENVPPPPPQLPSVTLDANPAVITAGEISTLNWTSTNADSCTASGGWSGSKALSGNAAVAPTVNTTYTLTCENAAGSASDSATVTVNQPVPLPTVSLDAFPTEILAGATSTLTWSSTNADTCTASDGWSGNKTLSGSLVIGPATTTTYTLACANQTGTTTDSATVNVTQPVPPPTVTLDANPNQINEGATSTLSWFSTNATSCLAGDGWSGAKATSGSEIVAPTATTTYMLTCSGSGGEAATSTTVGVTPTPPELTLDHVVISEVYYDTDATHGSEPANEWVELYNPTNGAINLAGWSVVDAATSTDVISSAVSIAAHGFVILTASSTLGNFWTIPGGVPIVNFGGTVGNGLGNSGDSLRLLNAASTTVDALSWGTNTTVFSPSVSDVDAGHSLARDPLTVDTNTAADWLDRMTPTPGS